VARPFAGAFFTFYISLVGTFNVRCTLHRLCYLPEDLSDPSAALPYGIHALLRQWRALLQVWFTFYISLLGTFNFCMEYPLLFLLSLRSTRDLSDPSAALPYGIHSLLRQWRALLQVPSLLSIFLYFVGLLSLLYTPRAAAPMAGAAASAFFTFYASLLATFLFYVSLLCTFTLFTFLYFTLYIHFSLLCTLPFFTLYLHCLCCVPKGRPALPYGMPALLHQRQALLQVCSLLSTLYFVPLLSLLTFILWCTCSLLYFVPLHSLHSLLSTRELSDPSAALPYGIHALLRQWRALLQVPLLSTFLYFVLLLSLLYTPRAAAPVAGAAAGAFFTFYASTFYVSLL